MFLPTNPFHQSFYVFLLSVVRYLFIAGIAFVLFYIIFKNKSRFIKIQQRFPTGSDYRREIVYSFITFIFFACVPLLLNNHFVKPYTTIYRNIHQHSMWYFWLAFPLMLLIHDSYFYWMHRLMHDNRLFRFFHVVHHKSTNPSPWASFSFQPAEAIVEAGIMIVFAFTIPIHLIHLFAFLVFMTLYNVYGHLGYELFPAGSHRHWLGKWFNTSVNHNMHHQYFKGNYGLYFTFWDRIMHTTHQDYEAHFEKATKKIAAHRAETS